MTVMDVMNLIQSPVAILSLIISIWCVYLIKKVSRDLSQEIKDVDAKLDALKSNDLAHIERHLKITDSLLVKEGRMTAPAYAGVGINFLMASGPQGRMMKQTYYATWGEAPFDVDVVGA